MTRTEAINQASMFRQNLTKDVVEWGRMELGRKMTHAGCILKPPEQYLEYLGLHKIVDVLEAVLVDFKFEADNSDQEIIVR